MVFPSIPPAYLDPPNWQPLQVNQQESIHGGLAGRPAAPTDHQQAHVLVQGGHGGPRGYGGGGGSIRPGSMADRARMENIPMAEAAPKCPRCESTNTKFCYFNNYSLTQPRHFCKTCRRYWTRGGALRNVPVGGGCRRNKRSSTKSSTNSDNNSPSSKSNSPRANTQIMTQQRGLFGGGSTPNTSSTMMMINNNSNNNNISANILGFTSATQIPQLRFMGHHHSVESAVLPPHHDYIGYGTGLNINSSSADQVIRTSASHAGAHQMNMNFNNLFGSGSSSDGGAAAAAASVFYPFHGQLLMDQSAGGAASHGGGMLYSSGSYNNHDQGAGNTIELGVYHGSYGSGAKVLAATTSMISDQMPSVKVEDRHPNVKTSINLSNNIGNYNNRQGQLEQDEDGSTTTTRQLMGTGVISTSQDHEWSNGSAGAAWTDLSG